MKRTALILAIVLGLLASAPAEAVTLSGKATAAGTPTFNVTHGPGGMLSITVYWKSKNALLFLVGACDDGSGFVSGSLQDRFTQVQVEVDPGATCMVEARSRRNSSKFWINFRGTGIFGAPGPQALQVGRSAVSTPLLDELARLGKDTPPR